MERFSSSYQGYSQNNSKQTRNEEELIREAKNICFKVMKDFKECSHTLLSLSQFDNESKENALLNLDISINGSLIKFKHLQKSFPKQKYAVFSKTMDDLLEELLEIDPYKGALSEPFERFKLVLKSKNDIMIEEPQKLDDFSSQKQNQMKEVQQLLNMMKDTYDRAIAAFNSCIKSLQTQNPVFYHQAQDLNLIIDTTSLQLRTIVEKFPQAFSQYLTMTFENMFQDFTKFKNAMPRREREQLVEFILRFEEAILLDHLMQKLDSTESFEDKEIHRKEKTKKNSGSPSVDKRYEEVKKSMLKCIALSKQKKSDNSFYTEKGNLVLCIKKAEEQFESIQGQQLSSKEARILDEKIRNMKCDWDSLQKNVSQVQRLSDEYFKFSRFLTKFINKL